MMEKDVIMVPVVAGVVIKEKNKHLLVQEKNPKAYGLWNWPAGKVDVGDTIEQTAVREAKEESGFDVELIRKLGIFQDAADRPPCHAFEARILGGKLKYPEDEILDARWFTISEIKKMEKELRGSWVLGAIEIMEKKR